MISLDIKSETKGSSVSPLALHTPTDEPVLSFSELLRGISEEKDGKVIQNGSLLLSLVNEDKEVKEIKGKSKSDTLLSLLKGDEVVALNSSDEPVELNPVLTSNMTTKDLKVLISEAKSYLKDKIEESKEFKMAQVKELPKTLKGLVQVAKKFNIDISKITVEEVKIHVETKSQIKKDDVKVLSVKDAIEKSPVIQDNKDTKKSDTSHVKELLQTKNEKVEAVSVKEVKSEVSVVKERKAETVVGKSVKADNMTAKEDVKIEKEVAKEIKQQEVVVKETRKEVSFSKPDRKDVKSEVKLETTNKDKESDNATEEIKHKNEKIDDRLTQLKKDLKSTPLFKAQHIVEHTATEHIVQVKQHRVENKTSKSRADETLQLLLRGEKPQQQMQSLTADFSVATAKVIAPNATTEATRSLEKLLHGDSFTADDGVEIVKPEAQNISSDDGFELKLKEAKQMIKYLSADIKTAIDDYKSPFTRVKVQLNPAKLGEVDVTVVQRGKNLHVNLTSNNAAINTLIMNANDLKAQLTNSGINNASLNFNNTSQGSESGSHQQQNRHNEQQAHEEYNYFENEEANEEILSSLEIIVPQYG